MNVDFINLPDTPIAMVRHTGSYDQIGPVFDKLWQWVEANQVPVEKSIGIYWDNPDDMPASQLRSAACVQIPNGYLISNTGGVPVEKGSLAGGKYARYRYMGPYEGLGPVWSEMVDWVQGECGKTISENPAFEVYVNDPSDTPPAQLMTELFLPIE